MGIAGKNSLEQLKRASELLEEAVVLLQKFGMAPDDISRSLADAGAVLQSVDVASSAANSRDGIVQQLRVLKGQEHVASTLLDSEMALRFGNVLQHGRVTNGYAVDGSADHVAARGFQIEG